MSIPTRRTPKSTRTRARPRLNAGASIDDLLAAFERCRTPEGRARVGAALATSGVEDGRIRAALVQMLDDDPLNAAAYLSALGDRSVLPELSKAIDRLLETPIGDCEICQAEHLTAVATAIRCLGGTMSDAQLEAVEAILDRAAEQWIPLEDHCSVVGRPHPALSPSEREGARTASDRKRPLH